MVEVVEQLWAIPGVRFGVIVLGAVGAGFLLEALLTRTLGALARRTRSSVDDEVVAHLRRPVRLSALLLGLTWGTDELELAESPETVHAVLATLAVLIWTVAAMRIGGALLGALSRGAAQSAIVQPRTLPIFDLLVKLIVLGGATYFTFIAWGIDLTAWLASAGIIGIAVGFAAKDTLANLFAGIFILADAPYKLGDYVQIDGGYRGEVIRIGIRSTRVLTRDDIEVTIPNAVIASSRIVNETGGRHVKERVRVSVFVAYGSDVDDVRRVLLESAVGLDHVCEDPPPRVRFREFGDSGLRFELLAWIDEPEFRGRAIDQLNTRVYKAFIAAGIEIPYAKHDVYIKHLPARNGEPASPVAPRAQT